MKNRVAKSKPNQIPYSSRSLIRHAYDQVITHTARLAAFAASLPFPDMSTIEDRQDKLATDDLIALSLHMRRLIEVSSTDRLVRAATVHGVDDGKRSDIPITRMINKIIHHRRLDILRRQSDYMPPPDGTNESFNKWLKARNVAYYPMIVVQSDIGGFTGVRIAEFVIAAHNGITTPIVEFCADRDLHLEELDFS